MSDARKALEKIVEVRDFLGCSSSSYDQESAVDLNDAVKVLTDKLDALEDVLTDIASAHPDEFDGPDVYAQLRAYVDFVERTTSEALLSAAERTTSEAL